MLDRTLADCGEVEVDTGQPRGVLGTPIRTDGRGSSRSEGSRGSCNCTSITPIAVDQRAVGDATQSLLALLLREQEDVVVEPPRGGDGGHHHLHHDRDVNARAQRYDERDHVRAVVARARAPACGR